MLVETGCSRSIEVGALIPSTTMDSLRGALLSPSPTTLACSCLFFFLYRRILFCLSPCLDFGTGYFDGGVRVHNFVYTLSETSGGTRSWVVALIAGRGDATRNNRQGICTRHCARHCTRRCPRHCARNMLCEMAGNLRSGFLPLGARNSVARRAVRECRQFAL